MTEPLPATVRPPRTWPALLLIAAVITGLNAFKPLTMDDSAYAEYARQIAHHPFDPYGFQVFWSQWPEPANWLLAPPVLPYWWAVAMRWFGPSVVVWKLWLFPWVAAFVFAVHALLKRFAPSVALPMTVFTVFAPVFLPAINYMLDVPALGLGLAGLCVSMRATDRRSIGLAALAGIMFGLALQTKYTVATLPLVAAVYGLSRRRLVFAVVPGFIAAGLFAGWEAFVAHTYGRSHFLLHLGGSDPMTGSDPRYFLAFGAITLMGGLGGPLALMTALALGACRRVLISGAALVVASFAVTVVEPWGLAVFGLLGVCVWSTLAVGLLKLLRQQGDPAERRDDWFLLAAFAVEVGAFFAISPFSATRRLMGLTVVLVLVAARLLGRRAPSVEQTKTGRWLVGFGVGVGVLFFGVDWLDAAAERTAARSAGAIVQASRAAGERAYFVGHWGLQFYCQQAGMQPIVPDHTPLHRGDWIVFPRSGVNCQEVNLPPADLTQLATIGVTDVVPLRAAPPFYSGLLAIDHRSSPRLSLVVYRVKTAFTPQSRYSSQYIADWAVVRPPPLMPMAVAAVLRATRDVDAKTAEADLDAIAASGPEALVAAARDVDPQNRRWAVVQLGKLEPSPLVTAALRAAQSDPDTAVRAAATAALSRR